MQGDIFVEIENSLEDDENSSLAEKYITAQERIENYEKLLELDLPEWERRCYEDALGIRKIEQAFLGAGISDRGVQVFPTKD